MVMTNKAENNSVLFGSINLASINLSKPGPFIIISTVSICVYYLLNVNAPPMSDDLNLQFMFQGWFIDKITTPRVTSQSQMFDGSVVII